MPLGISTIDSLYDAEDSLILKSTSASRIAWWGTTNIKNYYETDFGLYNTTHNKYYYVATSGNFQKGAIEIFDLNDGTLLRTINNKNPTAFKAVCFNKSGNLLYAVDDWGYLQVLDFATMKIIFKKKISNNHMYSLHISNNDSVLGLAKMNTIFKKKVFGNSMWSLNISNNDSVLYIGTENSIILYSIFSKKVIKEIKGFHAAVTSLILSKDGEYFAVVPDFDTIQVFNSKGKLFRKICTHNTSIYSITFDPDSNIIYFSPNARIVEYCNYKLGNSIDTVKNSSTEFMDSENDEVLQILCISYPNLLGGKKLLYVSTLEGYLFIYVFCRDWNDCHYSVPLK